MANQEVGWLVELGGRASNTPQYWAVVDGDFGWTPDHSLAIRYARKEDAQKIINYYGWTEVKAVEHMWQ